MSTISSKDLYTVSVSRSLRKLYFMLYILEQINEK